MQLFSKPLTHLLSVMLLSGCLFLFARPAFAIDGFVNVTSPSGGETFTEGDSTTITWDTSDNIDKVSIMVKTDAHHGSWVAFSTENTKSYNWNVDVMNTTNTQFYIEITAYETGKGSVTNHGGYFTVNQKADPTVPPTTAPTAAPTVAPTVAPTFAPITVPTPRPQPAAVAPEPVMIGNYTFTWTETFWFEGSLTTDLSQIEDLSHVENLTLDTVYGWTYTFTENVDLTDPAKAEALQHIDEYWSMEWWYI